ncbi:asparagine synthase-related protein [Clostridium grantii]|uniref:asparagine synthase (glutamine-hydrolyzing) n=1 Tax=Clostridium grantii DSM 8605 TaxID=1121316 RepID=A0A1M5X5Y6_9CLOT|nr:asparagine synthase-related protein [Clostridium grantii]SHH95235.1 asparagine synthase (glutamine-hydrolysing) [Clostridium grantii DSM 8605]
MSAIFGVINFNGDSVSENVEIGMTNRLSKYKLDSIKVIHRKGMLMGCGMQYITAESLNEVLPYYDESSGLVITADAIIDNRVELFSLLNISNDIQNNISDSQLILMSFKKWGHKCTKYLIGDFTFAIWDEKNKNLFCARDHVGKRTFYYYYGEDFFAFATVINPIFEVLNKRPDLNEKWIADFLVLPLVVQEIQNNETVYESIYQLPPASHLDLHNKEITIHKYWNPLEEIKPLKLKSDKEYVKAFNEVFYEAINCRLRSTAEVGVMMSGGLDSGSVACIAAKQLSKKNKRLKAFSSIPMKEYNNNLQNGIIADESKYIKSIVDLYNNIDLTLCRSENENSVTNIGFLIDILEQPHKIIENLFWYNHIIENACKNNCKILLNGQCGNMTISYGYFMPHVLSLFRKGKIFNVIKEINGYSNLYRIPKNHVVKKTLKAVMPYSIRKFMTKNIYKNKDIFEMSLINQHLISKWNLESRIKDNGYYNYPFRYIDSKELQRNVVDPVALSQLALVETKLSLAHGIVERDPTCDKRVIEFCLSLPSGQFVRAGKERTLIRRATEGVLPDKIRLNYEERGRQGADWVQRLQPHWQTISDHMANALDNDAISKYIDVDKTRKCLDSIGNCMDEKSSQNVRMLIIILIFSEFIDKYFDDN